MRPLTLQGANFIAGERVRLAVSSDLDKRVVKVRADEAGTFQLVLEDVITGRSVAELAVSAVGADGSRVSFALNQPQRGDARV